VELRFLTGVFVCCASLNTFFVMCVFQSLLPNTRLLMDSSSNSTPVTWIHYLLFEMKQVSANHFAVSNITSLFNDAIMILSCRNNVALWRLYLAFLHNYEQVWDRERTPHKNIQPKIQFRLESIHKRQNELFQAMQVDATVVTTTTTNDPSKTADKKGHEMLHSTLTRFQERKKRRAQMLSKKDEISPAEQVKSMFDRAIRSCPFSKLLWLEGWQYLWLEMKQNNRSGEWQEQISLCEEKEIRLCSLPP